MSTLIHTSNNANSNVALTVKGTAAAAGLDTQRFNSISIIMEYDIDNKLNNAINENGISSHYIKNSPTPSPSPSPSPQSSPIGSGTRKNDREVEMEQPVMNPVTLSPPVTPNSNARKRWMILAKALRKDSEETVSSGEDLSEEQTASVRRFKSFDILRQDSFEDHEVLNDLGKPEHWYKYKVVLEEKRQEFTVNIHHSERQLTPTDLMGFNNTGNICVWPSEEALTAYILSNEKSYRYKWVLELGGGFTCLAGLMLAKYGEPRVVNLTDGNEVCVENIKRTLCLNDLNSYTKCSVLKWEGQLHPTDVCRYDLILCADCLFFDDVRSHLITTIFFALNFNGEALVMAPKRGQTMQLFIDECRERGFYVAMIECYNETIWKRHLELKNNPLYDENLHYPVLLRLTKVSQPLDLFH